MHDVLRTTLAEIEQTLEAESGALRTLDLAGIEHAAARKGELEARLRQCVRGPLDPADRAAIGRVRDKALANQLLLVHARACVRGALAIATGQSAQPYAQSPSHAASPLRVNLRG